MADIISILIAGVIVLVLVVGVFLAVVSTALSIRDWIFPPKKPAGPPSLADIRQRNLNAYMSYHFSPEGQASRNLTYTFSDAERAARRLSRHAAALASFGRQTDELADAIGWLDLKGQTFEEARAAGKMMAKQLLSGHTNAVSILQEARVLDFPDLYQFLQGLSNPLEEAATYYSDPRNPKGRFEASLPEVEALHALLSELEESWKCLPRDVALEATQTAVNNGMDVVEAADRFVCLDKLYVGQAGSGTLSADGMRELTVSDETLSIMISLKLQLLRRRVQKNDLEVYYNHDNSEIRQIVRDLIDLEWELAQLDKGKDEKTIPFPLGDLARRSREEEERRSANRT